MARSLGCLLVLVLLALAALFLSDYVRRHPQDVPWTSLDLNDPVGAFTGRKLAGLGDDAAQCRSLLRQAGSQDRPAPPVSADDECGYDDGIRITADGRVARYAPAPLVTSCPVAAALLVLERQVIDKAALRHFGRKVASIQHFGSYSCRRLYGREEGAFSQHASANAVDIAGFRLEDGTRISVAGDWNGDGPKARFLHEVRDGACSLFATVLSPDYNAAHADHLHLDQADRGQMGWRLCR